MVTLGEYLDWRLKRLAQFLIAIFLDDHSLSVRLVMFLLVRRSALDSLGKTIEVTKYTEKLVPSTRFVAVNGIAPRVNEMSFVAPSASVIGDVTIGKESR